MDGSHALALASRLSLQGFDRRALDYSMLGATAAAHMQLGPGRLRASIERLRFGRVAIRVTSFSAAVRATVEPPADVVTLGFVLAATEPFLIAGQRFHADMLIVFGAGAPTEVRYPAGSRSVTLAIPAGLYVREIAAIAKREAFRAGNANPRIQVETCDLARLKDVVATMGQLGADHPDLWLDRQWTANAERALLEAFLRPLNDPTLVPGAWRGRLRSARAVVREAEARMDADRLSIPSVPALCSALGVSRRTLERAFHDLLDVSPAHHLRVRALNAVRHELLRSEPRPGTITRIAIDNGFWHMGRFSMAYRALFGERPIDTLRQQDRFEE